MCEISFTLCSLEYISKLEHMVSFDVLMALVIFFPDGRVGFDQPEDKVWDREKHGVWDDEET